MKSIEEKLALCERSYYGFIAHHAQSDPNGLYLFDENFRLSWAETKEAIETLAVTFSDAGLKKGDFVAVRAVRTKDVALIFPAITLTGAVCVMTDAHFKVREFIEGCGVDISPDFFLTDEETGTGADAKGNWILSDGSGKTVLSVDPTRRQSGLSRKVSEMDAAVSVRDLSLIIFTSGSTGKSKAVMLCQRNYIANSVDGGDMFEEKKGDVAMLVLPLHHIFGLALIVCSTISGHALFVPASADLEYAAFCIQKYGVTVMYGVPTYFLSMIGEGIHKKYDMRSLRFGLVAGGPSTREQMEWIEREMGFTLVPVFGMSEYVGVTSCAYADSREVRCAGVGRFYALNQGCILNENGVKVGCGEEGEICVKGPELMLGYYKNPEETALAIDAEGRLHTGDLGYEDAQGIVHISGRKKDIIIRGGENISAAKIERELLLLNNVRFAAVVGIKDELLGEVPVAAVVLKKGEKSSQAELKAQLSAHLCKHEMPVKIVVMEALPQTSSEKTDKMKLKGMLA